MDEYISREDILENSEYTENFNLVVPVRFIKAMKAADVQPVKHGRWLHDRRTQWKCSVCGNFLDFDGLNCGRGTAFYCPNCGADMRGE